MGGYGSGRRHQGGKQTTSAFRSIDVRWLYRKRLLEPGTVGNVRWSMYGNAVTSLQVRAEDDQVIFTLKSPGMGDDRISKTHRVHLDWSKCHLGGERPWFRCAVPGCNRRVALIYCGDTFACRHCQALAYASQRETGYVRALGKMDRIRDKLAWGPGIITGDRSKPKGMHWRTFARLAAEHDGLVKRYVTGMSQRLEVAPQI